MKKKQLFMQAVFLLCLYSFQQTQAQIPGTPYNVKSPNSASLGLFGQIPVSYFTGIPDIGVPLYTLKQKDASLSVDLRYHASGFRPDTHPGWVGSGFSLSCGGMVSRVVKDEPDDYNNPSDTGNDLKYRFCGYYFNRAILNTTSWNKKIYVQNLARIGDASKDTEPDEFSFNFDGYSGSFYMSPDGSWRVKCDKPLSISLIGPFLDNPFTPPSNTNMAALGMSKTYGGFVITTENGTKYYFGGNTDAIEYSISMFEQYKDQFTAGSWYLTKVEPAIGEPIVLTYERDDYINQMYSSIYSVLQATLIKNSGMLICGLASPMVLAGSYNGKLISPVYLKKITGAHTVIKFNRSTSDELTYNTNKVYNDQYARFSTGQTGNQTSSFVPILEDNFSYSYPGFLNQLKWKKLHEIRVERLDSTLIKAFSFNYDNKASERLRLRSVTEKGSDLVSLPPFIFEYDESKELPGYLDNKVDHWGFYNGTFAIEAGNTADCANYYNYREPVEAYLYAGTLNKITYPTGGVTEFTYEPNRYSLRVQEERSKGLDNGFHVNTLAGGLRIKKISSYDSANPLQKQEKEYFYVSNYSNAVDQSMLFSSGVLAGQPKYYFLDYKEASYTHDAVYTTSVFASQSVLPGTISAQGNHVGYSEVVEKLSDGSYTKYYFSNFDTGAKDDAADTTIQLSHISYDPYSARDQDRGKLIKELQYSNQDKLLKKQEISYIALNKENEYVPAVKSNNLLICSGVGAMVEEGTAYRMYTYSYLPSTKITANYDDAGNFVTSTKSFNYNLSTRLLRDETSIDNRGRSVKASYSYPNDFSTTYPYSFMVAANVLSPVIKQSTFVNEVQTASKFTAYAPLSAGFVPVSLTTSTTTTSRPALKALADYDDKGNLQRLRKYTVDKGTTYILSYAGQYPIAKIENVDYATIMTALGGTTIVNTFRDVVEPTPAQVQAFLTPLYTLSNALVTSYIFDPAIGLISSKDANGKTTSFNYDNYQRLKAIKDQNDYLIKGYNYHYRPN
ncbi:hypothetical protein FBD94_25630 [Pedobacter hiemivivus]|uniref:RHS repeat protein n=1 Tax=Pedobacter hiemivivus TaxID=2530454 RepID=A0A4V5PC32_9SPHI|nr:hypothetical protein [Pedobacter hiemivivus]TKC54976.1 hypothetical protein FBD94_25630 [Pedobacter hiemivivus]